MLLAGGGFNGVMGAELVAEIKADREEKTLMACRSCGSENQTELGAEINSKRLTNTPVRQAGSVLKCPDDRKNRVVSAQATYPCGSSAVSGRVCEQR